MKKKVLLMLICLVLAITALSTSALAANVIKSGKCGDDLTWTIDENHVLTISGHGEMYDYGHENTSPWFDHSVDSVVIENDVTGIGNYSFYGCSKITELRIPASVDNIGDYAFEGCKNLQRFVVDKDNNYYCNDKIGLLYTKDVQVLKCAPMAMNEMTLPSSVNEIAYDAFSEGDNENIIRFTGDVITYYGTSIYDNTIYYPENNPTWTEAIKGAYGSNTWIEYDPAEAIVEASGKCGDDLTWILDINGVLTVSGTGDMWNVDDHWYANPEWYDYAEEITAVVIGEGVTGVGNWTFAGLEKLASVTFSNTVKEIDYHAFSGCESLESIYIPANVENIHDNAFSYSDNLKFNVDEANKYYSSDNDGILYDKEKTVIIQTPCSLSGDYAIREGVVELRFTTFDHCKGLTSITIPASVRNIETQFQLCINLREFKVDSDNSNYSNDENGALYNKNKTALLKVPSTISGTFTVPDGVMSINRSAFDYYRNLNCVVIPASVTVIEDGAFINCYSLKRFVVAENNPIFSSDKYGVLFNKDKSVMIDIPTGLSGTYTIPASVERFADDVLSELYYLDEIRFAGDAPEFGCGAFDISTMYYPKNNPTWTQEAMNQLDWITWIPYTPDGDVNLDGRITNTDLILVARYIVELYDAETVNDIKQYGDMDGDKMITNSDLIQMARIIVGL